MIFDFLAEEHCFFCVADLFGAAEHAHRSSLLRRPAVTSKELDQRRVHSARSVFQMEAEHAKECKQSNSHRKSWEES